MRCVRFAIGESALRALAILAASACGDAASAGVYEVLLSTRTPAVAS